MQFHFGISFHEIIDSEQPCQLVFCHCHFLPRVLTYKLIVRFVEAILLQEFSNEEARVVFWPKVLRIRIQIFVTGLR